MMQWRRYNWRLSNYIMNYMTYKELLDVLNKLNPEQLNQTVTVYDGTVDEYYPVNDCDFTKTTDVLDENHFFIEIK